MRIKSKRGGGIVAWISKVLLPEVNAKWYLR